MRNTTDLCDAALGLDPEAGEPGGDARRSGCQPRQAHCITSSLPFMGRGQDAKHPGWGTLSASANAGDDPTQPHPDGFAVCPSP